MKRTSIRPVRVWPAIAAIAALPACLGGGVRSEMKKSEVPSPVYVVETDRTVSEAGSALEEAARRQEFGVLIVHDLRAKMREKGVELANECRIYEVCNPHQAKKVLEGNMAISTALPCRISIYRQGGRTLLATILPTTMLRWFDEPGLEPVAEDVEGAMIAMMQEAAG